MFIVIVTYIKPLEIIDQYLQHHRNYLDECYAKNYLVVSGPQNPRTGGILVSALSNRKIVDELIEHDPFFIHKIAEYQVIEFNPVKYHDNFKQFII